MTRHSTPRQSVALMLLVLLTACRAGAQPTDASLPIRLSGNLNLTAEGYGVSGTNPRYPSSIARAILQANVTLFDQIQLPFQLFLSTQQLALQQPFNQFGVSPRFFDGKLTLHAGYFATQYSEFTFGDARILGGGVETDLGNFRVAMLYGEARTALQADTSQNFFGQYRRQTFAAKIGAGEMSGFHIAFNILYAVDDSNSIRALPNTPPPSENLAASFAFGFPITERIDVSGEIGASLFSNDLRSPKVEDINLPVFTLRFSSQLDGAAVLTINTRPLDDLAIGLNGRWIGPGYVSLGYVQLQNDLFDLTLSPSLKLLSGNLLLRGSFGLRFNNLRENRLAPSSRTIANLSATAQLSQTYTLRKIPLGNMMLFRASKSQSQTVGTDTTLRITTTPQTNINFVLREYNGMDITKLWGFPIEVDNLREQGQTVYLDGAFVSIPNNAQFKLVDSDSSLNFTNIPIEPIAGSDNGKGIPLSKPKNNQIIITDKNNFRDVRVYDKFSAKVFDPSGLKVAPLENNSDVGTVRGRVYLKKSSFSLSSGSVDFGGVAQSDTAFVLLRPDKSGAERFVIPVLTAHAQPAVNAPNGFNVATGNPNTITYKLFGFDAESPVSESFLLGDAIKLKTKLHTAFTNITPADMKIDIGIVTINTNSVQTSAGSTPISLSLGEKWKIESSNWSLDAQNGFLLKSGAIKTGSLDIGFTGY